jgi:DNA mismatch repair protein MutS
MTIVKDYLDFTEKWKNEYGERTLVLMQVGSFFEAYGLVDENNNIQGSNIVDFAEINDMAISRKNICVGKSKVVMAGFGLPQLDKYIKKLQDNGYTIVVYVQDSQSKNTTRSLNGIYSPGTYFSNESKELTNNIICIWINHSSNKIIGIGEQINIGISNIDIFTGKTSLFEFTMPYYHNPCTYDELERYISIYNPNECVILSNLEEYIIDDIINFTNIQCSKIHKIILNNKNNKTCNSDLHKTAENAQKQIYQQEIIKRFYPFDNEENIINEIQNYCFASQSFCYLLDFVYKHNPNLVSKLSKPLYENYTERLILANHSLKQLNIISDNRYNGKLSCVSKLLNNCVTPIGKRKFQYNLLNPITDIEKLNKSYNITDYLLTTDWNKYKELLEEIRDLEKLKRKLVMKKITPKDFSIIYNNILLIDKINILINKDKKLKQYFQDENINNIKSKSETIKKIITDFFDLDKAKHIDDINNISDSGNNSLKNMFFINKGLYEKVDNGYKKSIESRQLIECIRENFSNMIKEFEKSTKTTEFVKLHETPKMEPTLISTKRRTTFLKKSFESREKSIELKYKSEFTNSDETFKLDIDNIDFIPYNGNNSNVCITNSTIRNIAVSINNSKNELLGILELYYNEFVNKFIENNNILDDLIQFISEIDILQCKCFIASKYNYCKPIITESEKSFFNFTGIRHCLIEQLNTRELYVTNDLELGNTIKKDYSNGVLLYGTNAVGKTSFIKSIGICIIMAQAGLFVPCKTFEYYPYNYIFTRILGNDNIFKGLSTFAVEMSELRTILQFSNKNSLILGDELCSGTESDSALSIFVAGLEELHEIQSSFLFATHFHEIVKYEEVKNLNKIKLYHMEVMFDKITNKLVYDRKLKEGPGDSMYGLEVCKSLNLPQNFLHRAHELRVKYNNVYKNILHMETSKYNSKKVKGVCEMCNNNIGTEIHHLEYQKNANKNDYLEGGFHKNHVANLINICEDCHNNIHRNDNKKTAVKKKIVKKTKTENGYEII